MVSFQDGADKIREEEGVINTQTDILESIADEDAPMKVVHESTVEGAELKLTEVDQVTPTIPAALRITPKSYLNVTTQQNLQGMVSLEPCGEYCQWLSAESQREIIRGILTSTQGNTTLKASNGKPGEKRFLVNSVWWRKWCDFVNFDLVEVEPPSSQQEHLK